MSNLVQKKVLLVYGENEEKRKELFMSGNDISMFKGAEKYAGYYAQKGPEAYNQDKAAFERNLVKTQEYCRQHGLNPELAPIFAGTRFVLLPGVELEKPYPSLQDEFISGGFVSGASESEGYSDIIEQRYQELLKKYNISQS